MLESRQVIETGLEGLSVQDCIVVCRDDLDLCKKMSQKADWTQYVIR